jgi:M6 family metalloprotease-like protein
MRATNRLLIALLTLSLLSLPGLQSQAAIKVGSFCSKAGQERKSKGISLICTRAKGNLVWKKSKVATQPQNTTPTPSSSPTPAPTASPSPRNWNALRSTDDGFIYDYKNWCDLEKDLSGRLKDIEDAYKRQSGCSGIYRIAKYQLGTQRPSTPLTTDTTDLSITQCQISEPANSGNFRGFPNLFPSDRRDYHQRSIVPGPKMNVQVVPIFTGDSAAPSAKPKDDYEVYFEFLRNWSEYATDGTSAIQIRVPDNYLRFSKNLTSYSLLHDQRHNHPDHVRFVNDLVSEVDAQIDFSGTDFVLVIVPPGTPLKTFQQANIKSFNTNEGRIRNGATVYPLTLTDLNSVKYPNFLTPFWFLHELFHSGIGFDDHYGDGKRDVKSEYGLGWWTLMTPWGGELSAWEKWLLGFMKDPQVHCLNSREKNTRWIAPSSVKTEEKKMIVVPLSQTKGIIIESIRPGGLYYKIPVSSTGVLVYVADLEIQGHGLGLKVVLPTNRNPNPNDMFLSEAPLRVGESVVTNGVKISIVESGNFGDVVTVEPVTS